MAVNLTVPELLAALRMGDTPEETAQAARLLSYATEAVSRHLGTSFATTPDTVAEQATIMLCGYLWDRPYSSGGTGFADAGRNSGAWATLLPYRQHRAGKVDGAATVGTLPSGPGSDQTARTAAAAAQRTADTAQEAADGAQRTANGATTPSEAAAAARGVVAYWARSNNTDAIPLDKLGNVPSGGGDGVLNVFNGRLPASAIGMRLGWSQVRAFVAADFTRVSNHPLDGANFGMTNGLAVPPFPPALANDTNLYLGIWLTAAEGDPEVIAINRTGVFGGEDSLDFFPVADRQALSINGTAGYSYPSTVREFAVTDDVLSLTLGGGPVILTAGSARTENVIYARDAASVNDRDISHADLTAATQGDLEVVIEIDGAVRTLRTSISALKQLGLVNDTWRVDDADKGLVVTWQSATNNLRVQPIRGTSTNVYVGPVTLFVYG